MPDIYLIGPQIGDFVALSARREPPLTAWSAVSSLTMQAGTSAPDQMDPPTLLALSQSSARVTLAADPPDNGSTISRRDIRWSYDDATWTEVIDISSPYTLSGLTANPYVQARAHNAEGDGAWSASATVALYVEPEAAADALVVLRGDGTINRSGSPLRITRWIDSRSSSPVDYISEAEASSTGPRYAASAVNGVPGAEYRASESFTLRNTSFRSVGRANWSMVMLIQMAATPTGIRHLWDDTDGNEGVRLAVTSTGAASFQAWNDSGANVIVTSAAMTVGVPNVIAAWIDGTNLNIALNGGAPVQAAMTLATIGASGVDVANRSTIGVRCDGAVGQAGNGDWASFNGFIAGLAVADRRSRFVEAETRFMAMGGIA